MTNSYFCKSLLWLIMCGLTVNSAIILDYYRSDSKGLLMQLSGIWLPDFTAIPKVLYYNAMKDNGRSFHQKTSNVIVLCDFGGFCYRSLKNIRLTERF